MIKKKIFWALTIFYFMSFVRSSSCFFPSTFQGTWQLKLATANHHLPDISFEITKEKIEAFFGKASLQMKPIEIIENEENEVLKYTNITLGSLRFTKYPSVWEMEHIQKGIRYIYLVKKNGLFVCVSSSTSFCSTNTDNQLEQYHCIYGYFRDPLDHNINHEIQLIKKK